MFLQGSTCFTLCPTYLTRMIKESRKMRNLNMIDEAGIAARVNPRTNCAAGWPPTLRTGDVPLNGLQKSV